MKHSHIPLPHRALLSLAVTLALVGGAQAQAEDKPTHWFLKSISRAAGAAAQPQPPAIALVAGVLPDGTEGQEYSFDFKALTSVTPSHGISSVTYAIAGGNLPAGMSLRNDGLLSGTPVATGESGVNFSVVSSYLSLSGQQAYLIKIGEVTLEAVDIVAGGSHTCAVTTAGAAKCWGNNSDGQLGNGTTTGSGVPVQVTGLTSGVSSIHAGRRGACAVTTAGAVKCWGGNSNGQLGNGTTTNSSVPVQVTGLTSGVSHVSAGDLHACAVVSGAAKCWGYNGLGQLGNGTQIQSNVPVQASGLTSGVSHVSVASYHTCVVTTAGAAKCWGANNNGQLGNGTTTDAKVPVQVSGLTSGVGKVFAAGYHTCAVTTAGAAKCWGNNSHGQLGNGTTTASSVPVQVNGMGSGVGIVAAGTNYSCAVTAAGAAQCWGANNNGQLGNGTTTNSNVPVQVAGLTSGVGGIALSADHSCAMVSGAAAAKCWGYNLAGQLGNGTTTNSTQPVNVKRGS